MLIWCLFDDYLMIVVCFWVIWSILLVSVKICKVIYLLNFAFARPCCLALPARPAKVISDLLHSSLQNVPNTFWCRRLESYEREDADSPLQFSIWNSRIVRSACFAFDSIDGALATLRAWPSLLPPLKAISCRLSRHRLSRQSMAKWW